VPCLLIRFLLPVDNINSLIIVTIIIRYDTIRYDSVYLKYSKKLTGSTSQLSLPHGINNKLKCETKNKLMSVIGPVQSHYHEGSPVGKRSKVGRIC